MLGIMAVTALAAGVGYVRLAPSDPARWHRPVEQDEHTDFRGGALRVLPGDRTSLAAFDVALLALPRTRLLAGSLEEGRLTYITRSRVIGFPDYTTLELDGGQVKLFARLRFGGSDLGVNAARLDGLLRQVAP
ncbi:DUF1499 domain-containing protein [Sulfitobacter aestuarii]|uniref:DUF1499 domain-containing protein n=1 Tax=Sulfitobacter aestuarii TaxID=2161676 RepID=A0ABW5TZ59_9RHOB